MKLKILNMIYYVKASFWFVPALMAIAAIVLSLITIAIDKAYFQAGNQQWWWLYNGGIDGARTILSVITSSMMTVAGVVFSITIVVLAQASSQFGPRLIRNFMNMRSNQMVLGVFVASYIYGMLILHAIKESPNGSSSAGLSVTVAIVLSFSSLGVMIYFIHNISEKIQAQHIIARVHRDLDKTIGRLFPEKVDIQEERSIERRERTYQIPNECDNEACPVKAEKSGYFRGVDIEDLMAIAVEKNLLIHLGYRPGNFITQGSSLVTIWPGRAVDEALSNKINSLVIVGKERTLEQDLEYGISQMVEVAVRALSPSVNDPNTAMTCIDWLGDTLSRLARRRFPRSHIYDDRNRLRIIRKISDFPSIVDAAFNMIRQNAQSVPAVSIRILEATATIASQVVRQADMAALRKQASMVADGCAEMLSAHEDRNDIEERYQTVVKVLGGPSGSG